MTKTTLEKKYIDFWLQYSSVLPRRISLSPSEMSSPFKVEEQSQNTFRISIRLDFNRCRYKSTSSKKRDITIQIRGSKECVFSAADSAEITQSNVTVDYLRIIDEAKQKAVLLTCLRYDYENDPGSLINHPVYHCHFTNNRVGDSTILGTRFDIKSSDEVQRQILHPHIRIPTANMDMISVLLSIAADHFSLSEFQKVLRVYDNRRWHQELPHISHHNRFSPGFNFRSRSWYIG